jgi:pyrimidine deaminase RibD-like protein
LNEHDYPFIERAISLGAQSRSEDERPRPKVGAVLVMDGQILNCAYRGQIDRGEHAEFIVLERLLRNETVAGCTVYTTLEPCTVRNTSHKIPCAQRLIDRRVARVVIGTLDPNPAITSKGWRQLCDAGIDVDLFPRVYREQVEDQNREFFRAHKNPPLVAIPLETASTAPWLSVEIEDDTGINELVFLGVIGESSPGLSIRDIAKKNCISVSTSVQDTLPLAYAESHGLWIVLTSVTTHRARLMIGKIPDSDGSSATRIEEIASKGVSQVKAMLSKYLVGQTDHTIRWNAYIFSEGREFPAVRRHDSETWKLIGWDND